ncbi:hypothetical protein [Cellulosimicrobium protaetiae]|uniref:Cell wall-binding repeat-containing protein n=1 Tax=Cellulosimicrobium protaetiae TaxID=2587808 RepID=A0A6M5UF17_9MICO|nr:hypothetical protein [Cellulosimicrobium protaetiae]QJW35921.1 hypothetical protein FIC82_006660 [Cellulosimicrobium protaetiae]
MKSRKVRFVPVALPVVLTLGAGAVLGGCAAESAKADGPSSGETGLVARAAEPSDSVLVLDSTDPAELALTSSQAFFTSAPVVVLAVADDEAARATAAAAAVELAAPVLLVGGAISDGGLRTELARLGVVAVVEVGEADAPPGQEDTGEGPVRATVGDVDGVERVLLDVGALGSDGTIDPHDLDEVRAALPERGEPETLTEVLALTEPGGLDTPGGPQAAAIATARAAGAVPLEVPQGDPRASAEVVDALAAAKALAVVGIGESFGAADDLAWRLRTAEEGTLLPSGSQLVLADGVRYVAVEADAVTSSLVAVGERAASEAVSRAQDAAASYAEAVPEETVVPVLEVPATRASTSAGSDRDYSTEIPSVELLPLVDAAAEAGVLVVLRLEPGRATFDEQVTEYADVLARPTVGVALDVDARRPTDGSPAGTVDAAELGAAIDAVGEVVREGALPQKLVVVQRPDADAVRDAAALDLGAGEAAVVLRSTSGDGYAARVRDWGLLLDGLPDGMVGGWTTGSSDPARDVEGVLSLDPSPRYVAPSP